MAFLQDIKGALPAIRGPRYTVTLMGGEAAVVELIAVRGSDMVVTESGGGQLFVTGKVSAVEVLD